MPHLTVAENIFLGREPATLAGVLDRRAAARRSAAGSSTTSA